MTDKYTFIRFIIKHKGDNLEKILSTSLLCKEETEYMYIYIYIYIYIYNMYIYIMVFTTDGFFEVAILQKMLENTSYLNVSFSRKCVDKNEEEKKNGM